MASSSAADIDPSSNEESPPISFTVKTSKDEKYTLSLPTSTPVSELKSKLAELSHIEAGSQRLIFSGRVMKDEESLAFYKVQSGHTIHLVKGAASNQRASAGNVSGSTSGTSSATAGQTQAPRVPTNLASGAGNNPLAGLTGARYAGMAPLPNADIFGPDGGMGPPPDPDQMYNMMSQPGFQATMNEMLQNPQMLEYIIESNPQLRSIPGAREMMRSPEFRAMMTNPEMMRQATEMQRRLGMGPLGGARSNPSFPAPGLTDTTPTQPGQQQQEGQQDQHSQQAQQPNPALGNPFAAGGNPFAALFGAPPHASGGQPPNPFASFANLFGQPPFQQQQQHGSPPTPSQGTNSPPSTNPNPFGLPPVDWNAMSELLRTAYGPGAAGPGTAPGGGAGVGPGLGGLPPWLLPMMGGLGGGSGGAGAPPADNRPPEERYAEQLRQLNDMGFYDFDRNIEALRRSGGSVQGAVQHLLGD